MFTTGRYPTVARLVIDGSHLDAEETFNHALTTILDGITGRTGGTGGIGGTGGTGSSGSRA
jgi:hypothetical protein